MDLTSRCSPSHSWTFPLIPVSSFPLLIKIVLLTYGCKTILKTPFSALYLCSSSFLSVLSTLGCSLSNHCPKTSSRPPLFLSTVTVMDDRSAEGNKSWIKGIALAPSKAMSLRAGLCPAMSRKTWPSLVAGKVMPRHG
ncbi:hypothetical protein Scep_007369 [Stephania cephalantha]|uniref:Uncharacterized protein n=1 Tax=Stephania cephalantha TaxID=152367 RepID=A0AAP0PLQ9_9MAGN